MGYISTAVPEHALSKKERKELQREMTEVEERAAQIRAGRSDDEEAKRRVGDGGCIPWSVPEYGAFYISGQPGHRRKERLTKIYRRLPS